MTLPVRWMIVIVGLVAWRLGRPSAEVRPLDAAPRPAAMPAMRPRFVSPPPPPSLPPPSPSGEDDGAQADPDTQRPPPIGDEDDPDAEPPPEVAAVADGPLETVHGIVRDRLGNPIAGARVRTSVRGNTQMTSTDERGYYVVQATSFTEVEVGICADMIPRRADGDDEEVDFVVWECDIYFE